MQWSVSRKGERCFSGLKHVRVRSSPIVIVTVTVTGKETGKVLVIGTERVTGKEKRKGVWGKPIEETFLN